jgi:flagellar biosynthetic protein FliQ
MSADAVLSAARIMIVMTLMLATPFLAAAILASFVVGLIQAAARINDLTLSFVPRFIAVMLVVYFAAAGLSAQMAGYIERSAVAMSTALE